MEEKFKYYMKNTLSKKLNLCYFSTLFFPEKNDMEENKNPINKLITTFPEIEAIVNLGETDVLKFLYFNRIATHAILYEEEELINIKNANEDKLEFYQYLCLLIEENSSVVNYIYSIELIKKINELQTKLKNEKILKFIIAKIILIFINNFEQSDNEENTNGNYSEDLDNIKKFNSKIIESNIDELKQFKITSKDFSFKTLESIYIDIIKYLFVNKKLDDSEDTNNIIKQINLKNFYITKVIFDEILVLLRKENDFIKDYIISDYNDLFNLTKINFYYMLIKYILKNTFYIYEIPLLLETRNRILKLIKENISGLYVSMKQNRNYNDKIEFVLSAFIEYKYYIGKSKKIYTINANANTSQQASNQSNQPYIPNRSGSYNYGNVVIPNSSDTSGFFSNSSYKKAKEESGRSFEGYMEENVNEFKELEKKFGETTVFKFLKNSSFKFEIKKVDNEKKIKCILIKIDGKEENLNFDEIRNFTCENKIINNNFKNLIEFLNSFQNRIISSYTNDSTFSVTLNFRSNTVDSSVFLVDCTYLLEITDEDPMEYKDEDIFNTNEVNQNGFLSLINEINAN